MSFSAASLGTFFFVILYSTADIWTRGLLRYFKKIIIIFAEYFHYFTLVFLSFFPFFLYSCSPSFFFIKLRLEFLGYF